VSSKRKIIKCGFRSAECGMSKLEKKDIYYVIAVVLVSLIIYLITLAPTITSEDSGELIAAAYTCGVAHPPGYPLWTILGKLFTLIPASDPAWIVNYMSAFFASMTAGLIYIICVLLSAHRLPAAASALCLAFSKRFWSQSIIAEVYTINTFLFCGIIVFLLLWKGSKKDRYLYFASFIYGLSLANHYMIMVIVTLPLIGYVVWVDPKIYEKWKLLLICTGIVLLTQVIYIYLPIAASSRPLMNWGNPDTWERFKGHVTRKEYRKLDFGAKITPAVKLYFIGHFLYLLWLQFTPYILIPFTLLGWAALKTKNKERWLFAGTVIFNSVILILIITFTIEADNLSRVEEYYLPAYICFAIIIAMGLSRIPDYFKKAWQQKTALGLTLLAPVFPLISHWEFNDLSQYWLAYDYNTAIMKSLEKDAIYFPSADFNSFPVVYLQAVEQMRPDIILGNVTGNVSLQAEEYVHSINPEIDVKKQIAEMQREMIFKGKRPVYFTAKSDIKILGECRLDQWGLVYRVRPRKTEPLKDTPDIFKEEILRNLTIPTSLDGMGESIISNYYLMWGEHLIRKADKKGAEEKFRNAAKYTETNKEGLNNIAGTCAEHGFTRLAEELFRKSADLYPGYLFARRNLAKMLQNQGRLQEALQIYRELKDLEPEEKTLESLQRTIDAIEQAIQAQTRPQPKKRDLDAMLRQVLEELETDRNNPALYNNLGNIYAEKGEAKKALEAYHKAIKADPKYYKVYRNLSIFYKRVLKDEERAKYYMDRYTMLKRLESSKKQPKQGKR